MEKVSNASLTNTRGPVLKHGCTDYFLELRGCWEGGEQVVFVRGGCGVGENVGVLHRVGVLRHKQHAPALWLRSEV